MKTECIRLDPTRGDVTLTTYLLQDSPELLAGEKAAGASCSVF